MTYIFIDIETYSSVSLEEAGVYAYSESEDFEVLLTGYAVGRGAVKHIDHTDMFADDSEIRDLAKDPECIFVAHNANFERVCLSRIGIVVPPERWICTAVASCYAGFPRSLNDASRAMNLSETKDFTGKSLIKLFCIPQKDGSRVLPWSEPEKWSAFIKYLDQDVVVCRDILRYLMLNKLLPEPDVWTDYVIDQQINDNGALCDINFTECAQDICDELNAEKKEQLDAILAVHGLEITKMSSYRQWQKVVHALTGHEIKKTDKDAIAEYLEDPKYSAAWDILKLKQEITGSGVKKFESMRKAVSKDNRVRGAIIYYGAHTGRFSSKRVQLHNMPRTYLKDDEIDEARDAVFWHDRATLQSLGDEADILAQLVRTAFIAPEGKRYSVVDFSAIEARVIAWLCGEEWKLEVFRTHGKIYEAAASMMFNVPISEVTKDLRAKGKIAELALGYQGGVNALINFGAEKMGLSKNELKTIVELFRSSNPNIVKFWKFAQRAAERAIIGERVEGYGLVFEKCADNLTIKLPSGRRLHYAFPVLADGKYGKVIRYKADTGKGFLYVDTHGGKLTNNIVQAIARDLLTIAMRSLISHNYYLVLHVHDEVVAEITNDAEHEKMIELMCKLPAWADGLPQAAAGFIAKQYKK